jgi:hypothetical protein
MRGFRKVKTRIRDGCSALAGLETPDSHAALPEAAQATYAVQLILYEDGGTRVVEGTARVLPDGDLEIVAPLPQPPEAGTPVQVVIYRAKKPLVLEGTTTEPEADGSFEIVLN